jgi:hypothetical protein
VSGHFLHQEETIMAKKRFEVRVTETWLFWGSVEVEAESQDKAEQLAAEEFQVSWEDSDCSDRTTEISTEDGQPMKWSADAFERDSNNPYVAESEPALAAQSQPKRQP